VNIDKAPDAGLKDPLDRAARAFAVRAALDDAWPADRKISPAVAQVGPMRIGVGEIVQLLADPTRVLSLDCYKQVFADKNLALAWRMLKLELTVATMPVLVAAGMGALAGRRFSNGQIKIVPASTVGEVYVKILWKPDALLVPRTLLLEQEGVTLAKRELPLLRNENEFVIICVSGRDEDTNFLRLIGDPRTSGVFIP
jgi:hypothetical protein